MPRRIWKNKFKGYLNVLSAPLLITSLALISKPELLIPYIVSEEAVQLYTGLPLIGVLLRISGLGLLFPVILMFNLKSRPNDLRELAFWQSIFFLIYSIFLFLGPFFFHMHFFVYIPGGFLAITAIFLLTFASKNLLVRE